MIVDTESLKSYEAYIALRKVTDNLKLSFPTAPLDRLAKEFSLSSDISRLVVKAYSDNDFTLYPVEKCLFDTLGDTRGALEVLEHFLDNLEND